MITSFMVKKRKRDLTTIRLAKQIGKIDSKKRAMFNKHMAKQEKLTNRMFKLMDKAKKRKSKRYR